MHIVDRRLNPERQEPRQPAAVPAPGQGAGAGRGARRRSPGPRHQGRPARAARSRIPLDGMHEPRFRRDQAASRDHRAARQQEVHRGRHHPAPAAARAAAARKAARDGDGEDDFRFVLTRDEFLDLFLDDLELPDLAKRSWSRRPRAKASQRAGYSSPGSPANSRAQPHHAQLRCRAASRCKRPEADEIERAGSRDRRAATDEDERAELRRRARRS